MYVTLKKVMRVLLLFIAFVFLRKFLNERMVLKSEPGGTKFSHAQRIIISDSTKTNHDLIGDLTSSKLRHTKKFSFIKDWINTKPPVKVYHEENSTIIKEENNMSFTKDHEEQFTLIDERNQMRLAKVKQSCFKNFNQTLDIKPVVRALMNPSHDITYCRVNSAASSYVIDILREAFNCSVHRLETAASEILNMPYFEMRAAVALSYSFTIVREPYGRLFSTYGNNFYFPNSHWAPIGPEIVRRYRRTPSKDSLIYGHDVEFHEMIRFTVEEFEAGHDLDEHLRPMNEICYPCDYQYDFIGKLETIDSDLDYVRLLWAKTKHIYIHKEVGKGKDDLYKKSQISDTFDIIRGSNIPTYKLYLRAWSYFQMTGKIYKYINMPFKENVAIKYSDFERALEIAIERSKRFAGKTMGQKLEAMKQAYASVPLELLERLGKVVAFDCLLYGYEEKPTWLFSRDGEQKYFNYFKGLK